MRFSRVLSHLLKGKFLIVALVSIAAIGGTAAMAASTLGGQSLVHTFVGMTSAVNISAKPSATPTHGTIMGLKGTFTPGAGHVPTCSGLPAGQNMVGGISLNTTSASDLIKAICSLRAGTFKGTTPSGTVVSSSHVFSYGEIHGLLVYASYLAKHNTTNTSGQLTSTNARSYLAEALQRCGTSSVTACLTTNLPGFHPGMGGVNGQPTGTPTFPPHGMPTPRGIPIGTSTPGGMPMGTP